MWYNIADANHRRRLMTVKALEASGARPYDLVLTDMWMPNLDGAGLAVFLRADGGGAS